MNRFNWYLIGKYLVGIGSILSLVGLVLINTYEDYRPREYVQWTMVAGEPDILGKVTSNKNKIEARAFDGIVYEENVRFYAQVIVPSNSVMASCGGSPPIQETPVDPNWPPQQQDWGFQKIRAQEANVITDAKQITVCVLDTGLDKGHPDVKAESGQDFTGSGDWHDSFGHGTHVAGIISAINNQYGNIGVSQAKIIVGKVLGNDGSGSLEGIANGIKWCADQGAQVINMSLGGGGPTQLMYQALIYATQKGVKVMAAAGNDGGPTNYPAAFQIPGLYAISATTQNDQLARFSSRGKIEFAAPGENIYSTIPVNGCRICGSSKLWGKMSGTSMATPYASGVMALSLSVSKALIGDQVGSPQDYGQGRINALRSVQ